MTQPIDIADQYLWTVFDEQEGAVVYMVIYNFTSKWLGHWVLKRHAIMRAKSKNELYLITLLLH